jgi:CheY-like chemotaxis protein
MGRTILCVDDEALVLGVTRIALEQHGYKVLTAKSGGAAVSLLEQTNDDLALVLLDWCLPGQDGAAIVQKLKTLRPATRILATSGNGPADLPPDVAGLLLKPYAPKDLIHAVRHALKQVRRTAA